MEVLSIWELVIMILFFIVLFFLGRSITLWYFKINKMEEHLEEITLRMKEMVFHLEKLSGVELKGNTFGDEENLSKFQIERPQK